MPVIEFNIDKLREEELEEACAIQNVMLPAEPLRSGAVRISHAFHPASAVGGDFLDYFELPDSTIGIYMGDVSGKGLPAAMYAALVVGALRGVHKTGIFATRGCASRPRNSSRDFIEAYRRSFILESSTTTWPPPCSTTVC